MIIHFTRDSVCMGDDCLDNSRNYIFDDDASWKEIMPIIKEKHFLASVSGNNVVWVLVNTQGIEVLSYFTLTGKVIHYMNKCRLDDICNGDNRLHFKYFSSPKSVESIF